MNSPSQHRNWFPSKVYHTGKIEARCCLLYSLPNILSTLAGKGFFADLRREDSYHVCSSSIAILAHAVLQIEHYIVSASTASLLLVSRKVKRACCWNRWLQCNPWISCHLRDWFWTTTKQISSIHYSAQPLRMISRIARQEVRAVSKCPWELLPHKPPLPKEVPCFKQGGRPGVERELRDALPATEECLIHPSFHDLLPWLVCEASSGDISILLRREATVGALRKHVTDAWRHKGWQERARERERERERETLVTHLRREGSGGVLYCGDFSLSFIST